MSWTQFYLLVSFIYISHTLPVWGQIVFGAVALVLAIFAQIDESL